MQRPYKTSHTKSLFQGILALIIMAGCNSAGTVGAIELTNGHSDSVELRLRGVRADIDRDGVVDFSDFVILSENYGVPPGPSWSASDKSDLDRDGDVDEDDLDILSTWFGQRTIPLYSDVPSGVVPADTEQVTIRWEPIPELYDSYGVHSWETWDDPVKGHMGSDGLSFTFEPRPGFVYGMLVWPRVCEQPPNVNCTSTRSIGGADYAAFEVAAE